MSLVGTRPPLPNEWEAYELHHRAIQDQKIDLLISIDHFFQ